MWASLHGHSYYSLLDGLSSPLQLIERSVDVGIPAIALTDHGSCAGVISFQKAKKKYIEKLQWKLAHTEDSYEKEKILKKVESTRRLKLILGCEMYIANEKVNSHLVILAKNRAGWQDLMKMVSESTKKENFYRKPRLTLDQISTYAQRGNLVSFSGHGGSDLFNILWIDLDAAFKAKTYAEAKSLLCEDFKQRVTELAGRYHEIFGRDNFALENQLIDQDRLPATKVAAQVLRGLAAKEGYRCVATADSHYPTKDRAEDQQILLCNALKTTIPRVRRSLAFDEDIGLGGFFQSSKYYLPSPEEICAIHLEGEVKVSLELTESIEEYDLASKPIIPKFECPDSISSDDYMRQLCRQGWSRLYSHLRGEDKRVYGDRVKYELDVLQGAGLSDYFLIVQDILEWVKKDGGLVGVGRGSAAGCIVSQLLGITALDPIEHGLIFERFYNAGRNTATHTSFPDIDCDIQASLRERVVNYIKDKYGKTRVGYISNYGRLMGRSVLKDVFRAHEVLSFDEMNEVCQFIPDESAIADELQEMREEEGEASILKWALENNADELREWCWLTPEGVCDGPLAKYFSQAMRLEGTYRTRGQHAAGIVIFPDDIENIAPVIYDKNGDCCIAFDMKDIEYVGGVKMDILGVKILDKIADAQLDIQSNFLREQQ